MKKLTLSELGRIDADKYGAADKIPVDVILDNIRSGYNVGSFFRTADAFRIRRIFLCGITARPHHKEILKTAIGAENTVEWEYRQSVVQLTRDLKTGDYSVLGIEQTDESMGLQELNLDNDREYGIIFGNEVDGLTAEVLPFLDNAVEIPQYGTKHSFNVSVCGGIVLWEMAKIFWELN